MKVADLREVRKHLPLGSIVKIAEKLNISQGAVSQVFRGRYPRYKNVVLEIALEIIETVQESEKGVTEKANRLGLTTSEFSVPYQHKKKKVVEHKPRFADLYVMTDEQINSYLQEKGSKIHHEDYSGVFTSLETSHIRFINALCDEQGIKKPTWDDLKKMNHNGLSKVAADLKLDEIMMNVYPEDPDGENDLRSDIASRIQLPIEEE
jgi:predicted transcriptional regulator